jgi:hypothetical protein
MMPTMLVDAKLEVEAITIVDVEVNKVVQAYKR